MASKRVSDRCARGCVWRRLVCLSKFASSLYDVLGVAETASVSDLKLAFDARAASLSGADLRGKPSGAGFFFSLNPDDPQTSRLRLRVSAIRRGGPAMMLSGRLRCATASAARGLAHVSSAASQDGLWTGRLAGLAVQRCDEPLHG